MLEDNTINEFDRQVMKVLDKKSEYLNISETIVPIDCRCTIALPKFISEEEEIDDLLMFIGVNTGRIYHFSKKLFLKDIITVPKTSAFPSMLDSILKKKQREKKGRL